MKLAAVCAAGVLFLSMSNAWADFRVAIVDINRILNESSEAKEKRKELDSQQADAKKKLEEKGKALKATEQKIKEGKIAEDSKEGEKFREEAKSFSRMVKDTDEELKREFLKVNRALAEKAIKTIESYAKAHDIDLVLDRSEKGRSAVLFGKASFDITDSIVETMNE